MTKEKESIFTKLLNIVKNNFDAIEDNCCL